MLLLDASPETALALLRVETAHLPIIDRSRTEPVAAGETVLGIGSPFDARQSRPGSSQDSAATDSTSTTTKTSSRRTPPSRRGKRTLTLQIPVEERPAGSLGGERENQAPKKHEGPEHNAGAFDVGEEEPYYSSSSSFCLAFISSISSFDFPKKRTSQIPT